MRSNRDRQAVHLEGGLVGVAPAPVLAGLERQHDRMPVVGRVPARVAIGGGVAAANFAAGETEPQVEPAVARRRVIRLEAEILRQTQGPDAALPLVQGFASKNWWHGGAALALGRLYSEKGDVDLAEAALRRAASASS